MARWKEAVGEYPLNSVSGIVKERVRLIRENLADSRESCWFDGIGLISESLADSCIDVFF